MSKVDCKYVNTIIITIIVTIMIVTSAPPLAARTGFNIIPFYMAFVEDEVVMGQVVTNVSVPPCHSHFTEALCAFNYFSQTSHKLDIGSVVK
jgi:hypothetical protein